MKRPEPLTKEQLRWKNLEDAQEILWRAARMGAKPAQESRLNRAAYYLGKQFWEKP